jgi:CHAD domain-containing protein
LNPSTKCGSLYAACARHWGFSIVSCRAPSGAEAKRIASALAPARNWDAFRELVEVGPLTHYARDEGFEALLTAVEERRLTAYAGAQEVIDDPSTTRFVLNLRAFLAHRAWRNALSGAELLRLTEPARHFARETLGRFHKRALKRGQRISQKPLDERHEIPNCTQEHSLHGGIRQLFFGGARPYIRAVAQLQDGLGASNDAASAAYPLRDVEAVAGPRAAKAAGIVLGWCGGTVIADDNLRKAWKSFRRTRPSGTDRIASRALVHTYCVSELRVKHCLSPMGHAAGALCSASGGAEPGLKLPKGFA